MVLSIGLAMAGRDAPTTSVSTMLMMKMMMTIVYPTTAPFIHSGSFLFGSSVVDPSAEERFVSVSDLMILINN